jgi:hypothetical protein
MDMNGDFRAKYPQERIGVQGGELPISIKPKLVMIPSHYARIITVLVSF